MKQKTTILLPMLLAGSIFAQAKPTTKPAAPVVPAAKPVVPAAPATKAEAPAVAPSPAALAKTPMLTFVGWGGYNITIKASGQSSNNQTYGGLSGGLDTYYNQLLDGKLGLGLGVAFVTYYTATSYSATTTTGVTGVTFTSTTTTPAHRWNLFPIEAKARYKVWDELTVGVMAGYALTQTTLLNGTIPQFITVGVLVGYDYGLTDDIGINAGVDVRYLISTDSAIVTGNLAITPRLGVTYSF